MKSATNRMGCVYKLTRSDGLSYIGITDNLNKRFKSHSRSLRFQGNIVSCEILYYGNYKECSALEPQFILEHDTFNSGLNMTKSGRGKSDTTKFSMLGLTHTEKTKKKISDKAKQSFQNGRKMWNSGGGKFSIESINKMSKTRSGNIYSSKLSLNDVCFIRNMFKYSVQFGMLNGVGKIQRNGRKLNSHRAFVNQYKTFLIDMYNISDVQLYNIVAKKCWVGKNG